MSQRISKVNNLIKREVSQLFTREISFKSGVFVTIPRVITASDLLSAKIFVSVFPATEEDYAMKTIAHEHKNVQKLLHRKLHMRTLPKLEFIYDDTEERADEVEKIFHDPEFNA